VPACRTRRALNGLRRFADVAVIGGLVIVVAALLVQEFNLGRPPAEDAIEPASDLDDYDLYLAPRTQLALELNPNNAASWHDYAVYLTNFAGRPDESHRAVPHANEAPRSSNSKPRTLASPPPLVDGVAERPGHNRPQADR